MTSGGTTTRLAVIVNANTANAVVQIKRLGGAANASNKDIEKLNRDAARAGNGIGASMRRVVPSVRQVGLVAAGSAVAIGAAAAGAARSILKIGIDFQNSLNTLQAVTHATDRQMQAVSQRARDLGNDLSLPATSAADAADAMTELAKGNLTAQQAMDAAKGTLLLAAAAQIDGAEAAKVQANALNAFGLSADKAGHVADVLANAANSATGEVHDFALGLAASSAVAAQFGISVDDTVTALGLLANKGIQGSDAGTSLKASLLALASPSKQAREALNTLGLRAFDAHGKFVGLRSIAEQLAKAQKHLSQEAFAAAVSTAFGSDAARAAGVFAASGADGFDAMATAVGKAGGAATVAKAQMKGVGGAIQGLQSQLETIKIDVFQREAPHLEKFIRALSDRLPGAADAGLGALDRLTSTVESEVPKARKVAEKFGPAVETWVTGKLQLASQAATQVAAPALRGLGTILGELIPKVSGAGNAIDGVLKNAINAAGGVARKFEQEAGHLGESVAAAGQQVGQVAHDALPTLTGAMKAASGTLQVLLQSVTGAASILAPFTGSLVAGTLAVKGFGLASTGVTKARGAINNVTSAYGKMADAASFAAGRVTQTATKALGADLNTAGAAGANAMTKVRGAFTLMGQAALPVAIGVAAIGFALERSRQEEQNFIANTQKLYDGLRQGGAAADEAAAKLRELQHASDQNPILGKKIAKDLGYAKEASDFAYKSLTPLEQANQKVAAAQAELTKAIDTYGPATQQADLAEQQYNQALTQQGILQNQVADATKTTAERLDELTSKTQTAAGSSLNFQQQQLNYKSALDANKGAQEAYNLAVDNYGEKSAAAKRAGEALAQSNITVRQQVLSTAEAARQNAIAHDKSGDAEVAASNGAIAYKKELIKLAGQLAPNSPLRSYIEGLISDLGDVPSDINVVFHYSTDTTRYHPVGGGPAVADIRAGGGPVTRNRPYIVGEQGPELMVPDASGVIVPNSALRSPTRGGSVFGAGTANITINVTAPVGAHPADVGAQVVKAIREYEKRSGTGWRSAA